MNASTAEQKTLILVSADVASIRRRLAEEEDHPRQDFDVLAERLDAEILSYADLGATAPACARLLRRIAGPNVALAWLGFRRNADAYFTTAEKVGYPLALLLKFRRDARHVMIGHLLSPPHKKWFARLFRIFSRIDAMICYTSRQAKFAAQVLRVPEKKIHRIGFQVDQDFYSPDGADEGVGVLSVGRELRDYETLIEALRDTDIPLTIVGSSPWSKRRDRLRNRRMPDNVSLKRGISFGELRELYRNCALAAIPLQPVESPAGVTTLLEAQAVGKPVVVSASPGILDSLRAGRSAVIVPCGDAEAMRREILAILENRERALRIGAEGRSDVLARCTLDHFVDRIGKIFDEAGEGEGE
ncbi:glycosyltransferase family 4 protein [Kiritimatiella glycovorans]|uniref:Sugar transferase, PEP-CTERM/EpsH1 system associated n=1 Tax=Kiritimatiella glycovorans TaxID=1307763 RepID=A0A0G3EGJ2_9BACT|nr:glycosyltransferase family 4 protein [Kiritimatiella glycovorans]AKJ63905.1 sugar transferase, PEP-CTERM/EpsH1 system associated [Kiritimatiella glycovorans]